MDRVRFGRVLGKGARQAARTALEAVDAATAATPSQRTGTQPTRPQSAAPKTRHAQGQRMPTILAAGLAPAARAASASITSPLKQASRALWYELTGSFFALFAFAFAAGAWRTRAGLWSGFHADRNRFAAFCALALLFLYFSISSFLRARRRSTA